MDESNKTNGSDRENTGKPVPRNGHHAKIKRSSIAIYILAPLFAFAVAPLWLFIRAYLCSSEHEDLSFCENSFLAPAVLALGVIAVFAYIVFVMRDYGRSNQASMNESDRSQKGVWLAAKHIQHGFQNFEKTHQNHIRLSHFSFWVIWAVLLGVYLFFQELPTYVSYLAGGAVIALGWVLDRALLR
jgi:hypothetical protein